MFTEAIDGSVFSFETDPAVFSPGKIDAGTRAMLSEADLHPGDKILDLGCGYGVVGIWAAQKAGPENVVMCDILPAAVALSKENALRNGLDEIQIIQSDGFERIEAHDFTIILSNPPYHADFSVPKRFIEDGFRHLAIGGRLLMVTKRLDWYKNKLTSVFGGVRIKETDGYYVFTAEKRSEAPPPKSRKTRHLSKKLERARQNEKNVVKRRRRQY